MSSQFLVQTFLNTLLDSVDNFFLSDVYKKIHTVMF